MRALRLLVAGFFLGLLSLTALIALRGGARFGKLETIEYDFKKALGGKQRMTIYLPPGYPNDSPYPLMSDYFFSRHMPVRMAMSSADCPRSASSSSKRRQSVR
jgi:hypothetical protein